MCGGVPGVPPTLCRVLGEPSKRPNDGRQQTPFPLPKGEKSRQEPTKPPVALKETQGLNRQPHLLEAGDPISREVFPHPPEGTWFGRLPAGTPRVLKWGLLRLPGPVPGASRDGAGPRPGRVGGFGDPGLNRRHAPGEQRLGHCLFLSLQARGGWEEGRWWQRLPGSQPCSIKASYDPPIGRGGRTVWDTRLRSPDLHAVDGRPPSSPTHPRQAASPPLAKSVARPLSGSPG